MSKELYMRSLGLRQNKVDYLISFAVFLQSFLIVLQEIMISILKMDPESTTIYRVIFSAIPMSIAIILSLKRKKVLFIVTYLLAFLVSYLSSFHIFIYDSTFLFGIQYFCRFLLFIIPLFCFVICYIYYKYFFDWRIQWIYQKQ